MSGDIFAVLKKLQTKLIQINKEQPPLAINTDILNEELSSLNFVNHELLPKAMQGAQSDNTSATQEQVQHYSIQVLQAFFNIVNASIDGVMSAISNKEVIIKSSKFLDRSYPRFRDRGCPKIVDDRTYQVGKAIQEFLSDALSEETLNTIPERVLMQKVREPAKKFLIDMKNILEQRLAIYELHSNPEQIAPHVDLLKIKTERRALWFDQAKSTMTLCTQADRLAREINIDLNKEIPEEQMQVHLNHLEQKLLTLEDTLQKLQGEKIKFDAFNKQWNVENDAMHLPEKIKISPLMRALANYPNNPSEIVYEWHRLFNDLHVTQEINDERIGSALQSNFEDGERLINDADVLTAKYNVLLSTESKEVTLLKQYLEKLKKVNTALPAIEKPPVLNGEYPVLSLNNALSKEPDLGIRYKEDIESGNQAIDQLKSYKELLIGRKQNLKSLFLNECPVPIEANASRFKAYFKKAFAQEQQKLQPQVTDLENQIQAVNQLIQKTTLDVKRLERERIKLYREEALSTATNRIQETFAERSRSQIELNKMTYKYSTFLPIYNEQTSRIKQTYSTQFQSTAENKTESLARVQRETETLESLKIKQINREHFLINALEKLIRFKNDLDKNQSIYVPAAQIPKAALIEYLECANSRKLIKFLDALYEKEQSSNSRGGWNFNHLQDEFKHKMSFSGKSDFEYDLSELSIYIELKITQIRKELAGQEQQPNSSWIPKENLWHLEQLHNHTLHRKEEGESKLLRLEMEQKLLELEQEQQLDVWNVKKSALEHILDKKQLDKQLGELGNRQAVFALDILRLDYTLTDIEEREVNFDRELREFAQLGNEVIVAKTADFEVNLQKISDSMSTKAGPKESINDSVKNIQGGLSSLERLWKNVSELAKETIPPTVISPELSEEFLELQKHIHASLEEKGLNAIYSTLNAKIADKKMALPRLKELAQIQIQGTELLEKAALIATLSTDERDELYQAIKFFHNKIIKPMAVISEAPNLVVREKYAETTLILQRLDQINQTIIDLAKLEEINSIFSGLIKRVDGCKSGLVLARNVLRREIEAFSKSDLTASLTKIRKNTDPIVQEKLASILKMHQKIELFCFTNTPNSLFAEHEKRENKESIIEQLDNVIKQYDLLAQRYNNLPAWAPKVKQTLYTDIEAFEQSELVTTLEELESSKSNLGPKIQKKMAQISGLKDQLNSFKIQYKATAIEKELELSNERTLLEKKYFGSGSIFDNYLQERANTFLVRDLFHSFAALIFGCVGYKTEAQLRKDYINQLQISIKQYQETPSDKHEEEQQNHQKVLSFIDTGIQQFSPRNKSGEGHDKSLNARLMQLQREVGEMHEKFAPKKEAGDLGSVSIMAP